MQLNKELETLHTFKHVQIDAVDEGGDEGVAYADDGDDDDEGHCCIKVEMWEHQNVLKVSRSIDK